MTREERKTEAILPEPWLRGTWMEIPVVARAAVHALELASEDILRWCLPLSSEQLNKRPCDLPSIAFQLRHISRSLDRLLTYAEGEQLSKSQIAQLKTEMDPEPDKQALFEEFRQGIASATGRVRMLASSRLDQECGVGKRNLPTTVGGLLVHVADHTQRHVGQAITTAKVLQYRPPQPAGVEPAVEPAPVA